MAQQILALSGGVGGAKLALGLQQVLADHQLTVIANTADDFEHLGLPISPDLDTVMYTLAGLNNQQQGWGLAGETWQFMASLKTLNGETWFQLGDKDLATHIQRKQLLLANDLTAVTALLSQQLGVKLPILPMCNEPVATQVRLAEAFADYQAGQWMPFQEYFVRHQCQPIIDDYRFQGIEHGSISTAVADAVTEADGLIVCPSNPFVSIAPILAVPGLKSALSNIPARVVVSPIVAGAAIKGPAAKMMKELNLPVNALAVAELYKDFASLFVLDSQDEHYADAIRNIGLDVLVTDTIMQSDADKARLANDILEAI